MIPAPIPSRHLHHYLILTLQTGTFALRFKQELQDLLVEECISLNYFCCLFACSRARPLLSQSRLSRLPQLQRRGGCRSRRPCRCLRRHTARFPHLSSPVSPPFFSRRRPHSPSIWYRYITRLICSTPTSTSHLT